MSIMAATFLSATTFIQILGKHGFIVLLLSMLTILQLDNPRLLLGGNWRQSHVWT